MIERYSNHNSSSAFCCFTFCSIFFFICVLIDIYFYLQLILDDHNRKKLTCFSRICDNYGCENTQIQTGPCVGFLNLGEEIISSHRLLLILFTVWLYLYLKIKKLFFIFVIVLFIIISSKNKILPTYILPTCLLTSKRMIWIHCYRNLVKWYQLEFYVIRTWSAKELDLPGNMRYISMIFSVDQFNFVFINL